MYHYLWTAACPALLSEFPQSDESLRDVTVKAAPVQLPLVFLAAKIE